MDGISYFSTPRPGRRGGGSAITVDDEKYHSKQLVVDNPENHEVTFALLKPKTNDSTSFSIIACAIYSVPRSRKKAKLIDFISTSYNCLKIDYPKAYFIAGGDVNDLKVSELVEISSAFKQIVTKPTRKKKTLNVIVTDLWKYFKEPEILPPQKPDVEGVGKPSDHSVPIAQPYLNTSEPRTKSYSLKTVRTISDPKMCLIGLWLQKEQFEDILNTENPTDKVTALEDTIEKNMQKICPTKNITVFQKDTEWMTPNIQRLRRKKSREYRRNKKSTLYMKLQAEYLHLKKISTQKFLKEKIEVLKKTHPSKFYEGLRNIGARPGDDKNNLFTIDNQEGLSEAESAEQIAKYFSSISQEYPPLEPNNLPPRVKTKMFAPNVMDEAPVFKESEVEQQFRKRKSKKCTVRGDFQPRVKKEYGQDISRAATNIFNSISSTGEYPRQWVREYISPIPKTPQPETEDELRPISLTSDLSRDYNKWVATWLWPYIAHRIDPGQFGGRKGRSITQYLILLFHFILSKTDRRDR